MNVAFLTGMFPKISETFILNQASGLLGSNHALTVYASDRPGKDVQHELVQKCKMCEQTEYICIPHNPINGLQESIKAIPLAIEYPNEVVKSVIRGRKGIPRLTCLNEINKRDKAYDVYHAHFGNVGARWDFIPTLTNSPFIVSFYGFDASKTLRKRPNAFNLLFERADAVTVLSEDMKKDLESSGCSTEKISIQPIPIDVEQFVFSPSSSPEQEPVRVTTVARFVEKKGLDDALKAIAKVANQYRITYEIIGDGPLRSDLEEMVSQLEIENIVNFHGFKSLNKVRKILQKSDLFLLPSKTASDGSKEGTPTVLLEAQASGLPIVSTYHAGIPEIVSDGESGVLVPENNPDKLTQALQNLLADPDRWMEMGSTGRKYVEEVHDIPKVISRLEQIYQDCY